METFNRIAPDVILGRSVKIFGFANLYGCTVGDDSFPARGTHAREAMNDSESRPNRRPANRGVGSAAFLRSHLVRQCLSLFNAVFSFLISASRCSMSRSLCSAKARAVALSWQFTAMTAYPAILSLGLAAGSPSGSPVLNLDG